MGVAQPVRARARQASATAQRSRHRRAAQACELSADAGAGSLGIRHSLRSINCDIIYVHIVCLHGLG